jgi:hypothetical protein
MEIGRFYSKHVNLDWSLECGLNRSPYHKLGDLYSRKHSARVETRVQNGSVFSIVPKGLFSHVQSAPQHVNDFCESKTRRTNANSVARHAN